jgi:DNA polymerase sigma
VDICITTPWKELEGVCVIADLLHKSKLPVLPTAQAPADPPITEGMKKVVCISAAKVPIVKIWDPELGLACDMNVNNTQALENTRMVRTYIEIDPRVRPLAMIIKYWTRRRVLNDAGTFYPEPFL